MATVAIGDLKKLYGTGPFTLKGNALNDFNDFITSELGQKHQDVACILRQYVTAAALGKQGPKSTPQDICDVDINLDGALTVLQQKNSELAQLIAKKLKAKAPTDTTGYKPKPEPSDGKGPGKTPGKTPPSSTPPAVVQPGKPINWKPVLKWGGLLLAASGIGYFAWQKLQAR